MTVRRSASRRRWAVGLAFVAVAGLGYVIWPRQVDLRRFDPGALGRMEATMWRQYYERRYVALLGTLYQLNRSQYGFSPADSVRLASHAARAARAFQSTRSRAEAQVALPWLTQYFALIRTRTDGKPDAAELARLELEWWQQRREQVSPADYGRTIAQVEARLYDLPESDLRASAQLRAEMMAYRDARSRGRLGPEDWSHIAQQLTRSYQMLAAAVNAPGRARIGGGTP